MGNGNKHSDEKKSNKNQSDKENASTMSKLVDSVGMSTSSHKFIRERGISAQNEHRTGAGWSTLDAQHQSIFGHSFYTTYEKYYSEKFDEIEKLSNEEEKSRSLKNIKPLDIWLKDYVAELKISDSNNRFRKFYDKVKSSMTYLTEEELKDFEIQINEKDGGIVVKETHPYLKTKEIKGVDPSSFIYVLTEDALGDKKLYMARNELGKFHHSSFTGGKNVLCAGALKIKNNHISYVSNESGHFKPSQSRFRKTMLQYLHDKNALSSVESVKLLEAFAMRETKQESPSIGQIKNVESSVKILEGKKEIEGYFSSSQVPNVSDKLIVHARKIKEIVKKRNSIVENKDNISNVYTQVASVDNAMPNLYSHASDSGLHITHPYTQVPDFQQNEISEKEKLILAINDYLDVLKKESQTNSSSPQLFSYTDGGKEENMNALLALLKVVKGEDEVVTLDQYKGVLTQGKLSEFYQASLDIIQQPVRKNTP